MPWFASQIITPYNSDLLELLKQEKELENKIFVLKGEEFDDCNFPKEGLIFCHRLHDVFTEKNGSYRTELGASWFNDFLNHINVQIDVSWEDLKSFKELDLISADSAFLLMLKRISKGFNQKVLFYYGCTDGGFDENNSGWVFYPNQADKAINKNCHTFPQGWRIEHFWVCQNKKLQKEIGFPLNYILKELDINLKYFDEETNKYERTNFFKPHTRGFEWENYKI